MPDYVKIEGEHLLLCIYPVTKENEGIIFVIWSKKPQKPYIGSQKNYKNFSEATFGTELPGYLVPTHRNHYPESLRAIYSSSQQFLPKFRWNEAFSKH